MIVRSNNFATDNDGKRNIFFHVTGKFKSKCVNHFWSQRGGDDVIFFWKRSFSVTNQHKKWTYNKNSWHIKTLTISKSLRHQTNQTWLTFLAFCIHDKDTLELSGYVEENVRFTIIISSKIVRPDYHSVP